MVRSAVVPQNGNCERLLTGLYENIGCLAANSLRYLDEKGAVVDGRLHSSCLSPRARNEQGPWCRVNDLRRRMIQSVE